MAYKVVYVDPGKKNLLYMMNGEGVYFRYSNAERIVETKRLEYQSKIQNYKDENGISNTENELKDSNSKSCNVEDFKKYIKKKNEIVKKLAEEYEAEIFRKYKWYSFINRKRSEDILLNKIEKVFGKDIILIYGDWSVGKQMRNFISTPNISIKRKLATRFKIYSIDEFRTSLINYRNGKESENLYLPDRKGIMRKKHSILTYIMDNRRLGCINRDKNSVNNMKIITEYFLETRKRPEVYKRQKKKAQNTINLEALKKPNKINTQKEKIPKKKGVKVYKKRNLLVSNVSESP